MLGRTKEQQSNFTWQGIRVDKENHLVSPQDVIKEVLGLNPPAARSRWARCVKKGFIPKDSYKTHQFDTACDAVGATPEGVKALLQALKKSKNKEDREKVETFQSEKLEALAQKMGVDKALLVTNDERERGEEATNDRIGPSQSSITTRQGRRRGAARCRNKGSKTSGKRDTCHGKKRGRPPSKTHGYVKGYSPSWLDGGWTEDDEDNEDEVAGTEDDEGSGSDDLTGGPFGWRFSLYR